MEELIKQQRRMRISDPGYGDLSSTRGRNTLAGQQTGRKSNNWFQRQFSGETSLDQDTVSSEYAAAVAASAFAVHSADEAKEEKRRKMKEEFEASRDKRKTMMVDVKPGVSRRSSNKEADATIRKIPESTYPAARTTSRAANAYPSNTQSKGSAWEKAQMEKIRKRHEKVKANIHAWENEKKLKAKLSMEKKKSELEQKKGRNNQHYQSKIIRIEHIAGGARAQADEKRKIEEAQVKQKAKKIQSGEATVKYCFCF